MAKHTVVLEDQRGALVRRVGRAAAGAMVARGAAFVLASGRLRLADRRDVGGGLDRRTAPTITARQIERASDAWRGVGAAPSPDAAYQARRIALWPSIGDSLAVMAGRSS